MRNRPTAKRQKIKKKSTKNRPKINGKSMKNRPETVPGDPRSSSEATGAQKSRKEKQKSRFLEPPGDDQETQNSSKNALKKRWKNGTLIFFFCHFLIFKFSKVGFFAFLAILGPPWWSFLVILLDSCFSLFFLSKFTSFLEKSKNEKTRLDS